MTMYSRVTGPVMRKVHVNLDSVSNVAAADTSSGRRFLIALNACFSMVRRLVEVYFVSRWSL
jgi:hypothetical protein